MQLAVRSSDVTEETAVADGEQVINADSRKTARPLGEHSDAFHDAARMGAASSDLA